MWFGEIPACSWPHEKVRCEEGPHLCAYAFYLCQALSLKWTGPLSKLVRNVGIAWSITNAWLIGCINTRAWLACIQGTLCDVAMRCCDAMPRASCLWFLTVACNAMKGAFFRVGWSCGEAKAWLRCLESAGGYVLARKAARRQRTGILPAKMLARAKAPGRWPQYCAQRPEGCKRGGLRQATTPWRRFLKPREKHLWKRPADGQSIALGGRKAAKRHWRTGILGAPGRF